ncbi:MULTISPECIES: DUF3017 domain-containing protein [unclassified Streptomyces]|uniref:DUF3017 domain-containing protein n=1 Tax=unclassified Streptomyces TaxID=2593676 RepID=UPI00081EC557|nr:DUF3017 domain-containing protein [Streptomyces sp. LcepLS]MYR25306.1 DUF3017 domain-containing protein [Streptomyces sp. SID4945]SCE78313.1 Protein of unknown function [Streptomyces sp. LcepLS]
MAGEPNESRTPASATDHPDRTDRAEFARPDAERRPRREAHGATAVTAPEVPEAAGEAAADEETPVVTEVVSAPGPDGQPMRATREVSGITRDTARPEGGGRAAPADAPAPARQWPIISVLATTGVGLLVTGLGAFRVGTLLVGLALLLGAVLRWTVGAVGMLAVRSRFTDTLTYGVLGLVVFFLALMVQPDPWLVIPFLDEILHFTVD